MHASSRRGWLATLGIAALAPLTWHAGAATASWFAPVEPKFQMVDELLETLEFVDLDDGQGGSVRTLRFSGVNLQVVNGLGATNGNPGDPVAIEEEQVATNGLGNLIVGYNEALSAGSPIRTGSHNLVTGQYNGYSSFGGIVVGRRNAITAPYATVSGGLSNQASGPFSAVAGGRQNTASADSSFAAGGRRNEASAYASVVLGGGSDTEGEGNAATEEFAVVVGGRNSTASGLGSSVFGGSGNLANETLAVVVGGSGNTAGGESSTILGGQNRQATENFEVLGDGGTDLDWTLGQQGGATTLTANADRVGIGTAAPSSALEVVATSGASTAMEVHGDLAVGWQDDPTPDASEHIQLQAESKRWVVGAVNDAEPDSSAFFVGHESAPDGTFVLEPDGDLGLGTSAPQSALHVKRDGEARLVLEGGALAEGAEAGIRMLQEGGVEGQLGFFDQRLVFRHASGPGLTLEENGVAVDGTLEVEGPAIFQSDLTVEGNTGIAGSAVVHGDLRVGGDLLQVKGDLTVEGKADWGVLSPLAWGTVEDDATIVSGSDNWSIEWSGDRYTIVVDAAPSSDALILVQKWTSIPMSTGLPLLDSNLASNEFTVKFHDALFPAQPFSFVILNN